MYLRVDNNGEEQLYSFENQKSVIIGRAPTSDIQLVTEGISRKHLEVIEKDGEYFVIDFGSTNGTFLNDDRLEPNKEHPFNSFFPLKLGFHVFLYLVDEVSPDQLKEAVVSSMQKQVESVPTTRTKPVKASSDKSGSLKIKKKSITAGAKPASTSRDRTRKKSSKNRDNEERPNYLLYFAVFMIALIGVAYSQGFLDTFFKSEEPKPVVAKKVRPFKKKKAEPKKVEKKQSLIPEREEIVSRMTLDKCLTDEERQFCNKLLPNYERDFNEGVSIFLETAYLILDYTKVESYFDKISIEPEAREELLAIAQKAMGRSFLRDRFISNNYKGGEFIVNKKNIVIFFLYDLIRANYLESMRSQNIKNFTFILYRNGQRNVPYVYGNFKREVIEKIANNQELFKFLRFSMLADESIIFHRALYSNLKDFKFTPLLKEIEVFN
jgi:hypothetical protein